MNRCSKCNNELVADARFCNICGTPVPTAPATPTGGLKRTIHPDIRRVRPLREGQTITASLAPEAPNAPQAPDAPQTSTPIKPRSWNERDNKAAETGSDTPETAAVTPAQQKPNTTRPLIPPVIIPKTTIEFTSVKAGQAAEKQKAGSPDSAPKTAAPTKEIADAVTSALPDSTPSAPAKTLPPTPANDAPVKTAPPSTVEETPAKTAPLPAPDSAPAKTSPLPAPAPGAGRVPGIIRPIVTTASLRQNAPVAPGQAPPRPSSQIGRASCRERV